MNYGKNKGFKCDVPVCDREAAKRGYCVTHYAAYRKSGGYVPNRAVKPNRPKGTPKPKCSVAVCDKVSRAEGYCVTHYKWSVKNKGKVPTHAIRKPQNPTCSYPDCDRKPNARNICKMHFLRELRARRRFERESLEKC